MEPETDTLIVDRGQIEAFVLCLALGTYEAMRSGVWPTEAGIWTLGRPCFHKRVEKIGLPKRVLDALRVADEINLLETMGGIEEANKTLDRCISVIKDRLAKLPERTWYAEWERGRPGSVR